MLLSWEKYNSSVCVNVVVIFWNKSCQREFEKSLLSFLITSFLSLISQEKVSWSPPVLKTDTLVSFIGIASRVNEFIAFKAKTWLTLTVSSQEFLHLIFSQHVKTASSPSLLRHMEFSTSRVGDEIVTHYSPSAATYIITHNPGSTDGLRIPALRPRV